MSNFFKKIIFSLIKPRVVLFFGENYEASYGLIARALKPYFKICNAQGSMPLAKDQEDIFVFDYEKIQDQASFVAANSQLPTFILASSADPEPLKKMLKNLPASAVLIVDADEENYKDIAKESVVKTISYGFSEKANLRVTDLNTGIQEVNFKINYEGNSVPVWLPGVSQEKELGRAMIAICLGVALGKNLVDLSRALKPQM